MPIATKLREFLDRNGIKYQVIHHSQAFTAQELAAAMHVSGKEMAKTVVVKSGGAFHMVVLPATRKVDFSALRRELGGKETALATEQEFSDLFPGCEPGAMPPFGNLYELPVIASRSLAEDEEIVFNAGTHTDAIRMHYADFEKLVKPAIREIDKPAGV